MAAISAGLGLAAFNNAASVLNGEIIKRTYRSRAIAALQDQFGDVPTAAVCALIGVSLMYFAVKF